MTSAVQGFAADLGLANGPVGGLIGGLIGLVINAIARVLAADETAGDDH